MSFEGQLNMRATVERASATTSDTGEVSLNWSVVATDIPCALQLRSANGRQRAPGFRLEMTHLAYFPFDADLRPQSQGGVGDRVTIDGASYMVLCANNVAGKGRFLRAELKRES